MYTATAAPVVRPAHLEKAGVYDESGHELTMAHVIEHHRNLLGTPLRKLIAHQQRHLDDPTHPIHADVAEAVHSRLTGRWHLDHFSEPIEYYVAKVLGCKEADVPAWTTLSASVQQQAELLLRRNCKPTVGEWDETFDNLFLQTGINALWQCAEGNPGGANTSGSAAAAAAVFNNAQARVAVGDSTTAAAATQTWLSAATNKYAQGMDSTYPVLSGGGGTSTTYTTSTFRITVASGNANYSWQEFCVDNGNGSNSTSTTLSGGSSIDRVVSNQGTKASGQTWQPSLALTIS